MVVTVIRQLFGKNAEKVGFTIYEALASDAVWIICLGLYVLFIM